MGKKTIYLLTGDIGGTNSRMSFYAAETPSIDDKPVVVKYFRNAEYLPPETFSDPTAYRTRIIIPFLEHCWKTAGGKSLVPIEECQIVAVLATAGLIGLNNSVKMTNLGNLLIDGAAIEKDTSDPYLKSLVVCKIINDFVAQGYGCLTLKPDEVRVLNGPADASHLPDDLPGGPKVCVGAGTGLGECYLTPDSEGFYSCFASEGGHVEYAPRSDVEIELWKYLSDKFSSKHRISVERVVSGTGLANVYEFLAHKFPGKVVDKVHQEFLQAGDQQGRVVATNITPGSLCEQAMRIMMGAYGCEVGSAAIKWIPTGGLFVTGGLTPKNIKYIEGNHSEFMIGYKNKGRVAALLDRVPLFAVMVEDLGVRGVHKAALSEYERFVARSSGSGATTTTTTTTTTVVSSGAKDERRLREQMGMMTMVAAVGVCAGMFWGKQRR